MLRITLLILGSLLLLAAWVLASHPGLTPIVIYLSVDGIVILGGILFERHRYRPPLDRTRGVWQATGERFMDPTTGRLTDVYFNPDTGERDYREITSETS